MNCDIKQDFSQMMMIKKLFKFIAYFEDEHAEFYKWVSNKDSDFPMRYPVYDEKLLDFVQTVSESGILRTDYLSFLNEKVGSLEHPLEVIKETNDPEILIAMLTYFIRQERFYEGLWAKAVDERIFLQILLKLRDLESQVNEQYLE